MEQEDVYTVIHFLPWVTIGKRTGRTTFAIVRDSCIVNALTRVNEYTKNEPMNILLGIKEAQLQKGLTLKKCLPSCVWDAIKNSTERVHFVDVFAL